MEKLSMKKNNEWWLLLLEGLLLVSLGTILFSYPGEILTAIAYWFGIFVILAGAIGVIWFFRKNEKKLLHLVFSIAVVIAGILMVTKIIATITAVTAVFGLIGTIVSVVLIRTGWNQRRIIPGWILPVLLGVAALIINIKGVWDTFTNTSVISHFIGKSVLIAGIGLVVLSFLRMIAKHRLGNRSTVKTN